tara:strand:- start:1405 stop:2211 length:807 start_codon:yes stop_codon:yes gene_type:complete
MLKINLILILLIIYLIYLNQCFFFTKENFVNTNILDISICVACYPPHLNRIKNLLDSINIGSTYPKDCIIGLSETNSSEAKLIEDEFNKKYNFKIIITPSEKKCNQSENRNRAFELSNSKYITINDADDIVHKDRLKIIFDIMEKTDCKALLHSYISPNNLEKKIDLYSNNWDLPKKYEIKSSEELYEIAEKTKNITLHFVPLATHGYITFKKTILNDIKQNILFDNNNNNNFKQMGEDSIFARDILKKFGKTNSLLFYNIQLLKYIE